MQLNSQAKVVKI